MPLFGLLLFCLLLFPSCGSAPLRDNDRIASFLDDESLDYEIDKEGDFRIIGNSDFPVRDVWIKGHINYSAEVGVREIFSVSTDVNGDEIQRIAPVLLIDNTQTRVIGSWSLVEDKERDVFLILYTAKVPVRADRAYIVQAVRELSEAASVLERVLSPED